MKLGANPGIKNKAGKTPADPAHNNEVLQLLQPANKKTVDSGVVRY
jgi:hypothetical protein